MNSVATDVVSAVNELIHLPETIEKLLRRACDATAAVDILDTPDNLIFYIDVPGLSKSDIRVTVEEENTLVIKSNGKRKREEGEEEGCKYVRLERCGSTKFVRKFRLPENSNAAAVTAKCENGVLTITVEKLPPPQKPKTVQVAIS
ncbi:hypothetical protein Syun_026640 [Stephania yunnanensis]|uniref:SHSP domain-containing protein n=1 Tax=Stephania yunnanensis TaxID=152371 RepID=A0AAP0ETZ4_9MAGN